MNYYKAEIVSIDAWKEDGLWQWNQSLSIEKDIVFSEDSLTARKIFFYLRRWGFLTDANVGKLKLDDSWPILEIQNKDTNEPLLALIFEEIKYKNN